MLCTSPAGVGDLGHCVIKQMTLLSGSEEQPCFHRFPRMQDRYPLWINSQIVHPLLSKASKYPFWENEKVQKTPTDWAIWKKAQKLTSGFESERAEQKSRSWFYQSGLKRLQPRSRELPQHEVCIGSSSNLSAPASGASTTFTRAVLQQLLHSHQGFSLPCCSVMPVWAFSPGPAWVSYVFWEGQRS